MKKLVLLCSLSILMTSMVNAQDQYIFPSGSGPNKLFMKEIIKLTGKERPKICFLPTASGDSERSIIRWYELTHDLSIEPSVQRVWISSYRQKQTFEEWGKRFERNQIRTIGIGVSDRVNGDEIIPVVGESNFYKKQKFNEILTKEFRKSLAICDRK